MRHLFLLLALLLVAPAARADGTADAEKLVAIMEKLAVIVEAAKGDCDKLAASVSKFAEGNATVIKFLAAKLDKLSPEEKKVVKEKFGFRVATAQAKIGEGAKKCTGHKGAEDAFKKLLAK